MEWPFVYAMIRPSNAPNGWMLARPLARQLIRRQLLSKRKKKKTTTLLTFHVDGKQAAQEDIAWQGDLIGRLAVLVALVEVGCLLLLDEQLLLLLKLGG